jgi:hypothetical protein
MGTILGLGQAGATEWANGGDFMTGVEGALPSVISSFVGGLFPGPLGSIVGTIAGGFIGRLFGGGKKKPETQIKPIPVAIMNWDVLGAMLNVSRGMIARSASGGYGQIASMRMSLERVGL